MRLWGHLVGRWAVPQRYERFTQEMDRAMRLASDPERGEEQRRELLKATFRLGRACRRSYADGIGFAEAVWSWAKIEEFVDRVGQLADAAHSRVSEADGATHREHLREQARSLHYARIAAKDLRARALISFGHSRSSMAAPSTDDTSAAAVEEFGKHRRTAVRMLGATKLAVSAATVLMFTVLADLWESDIWWPEVHAALCAVVAAAGARAWVLDRRLPVRTRWFTFGPSRFLHVGPTFSHADGATDGSLDIYGPSALEGRARQRRDLKGRDPDAVAGASGTFDAGSFG